MTTDPVEFVSKVIPEMFNAAIADMLSAADAGDAGAKQRHADLLATQAALRVVLEGKGGADLYLVVQGGAMQALKTAPSCPVLLALALPREALEVALEELADDLEKGLPKLQKRLTRLRVADLMAMFERVKAEPLLFHHVLEDTPVFEEILIKIALGGGTPPEKPTFTVTLDYENFEEMRAGKVKPQAVMGRLQLSGDPSRAMQLGMELMQRRK